MLVRIVRMTFQKDKIDTFLANFEQSKNKIRAYEGCHHLELLRDSEYDNIYYTYSIWKSEEDLNNYRKSDLFRGVWAKTKVLFAEKPQVHSLLPQVKV